jgi:uncharacterized protein
MLPDLALVVNLQALDQRLAELEKEIATLPRQIAAIERQLEAHTRRLEADRAALAANQRDRKKLEGEIQVQEQKVSKLKDQTLQAKTNEQYRAFQHEISYCEDQIRQFEDKILELMGESEPLDRNVQAAESALKQERAVVEAEKKRAQDRTAQDRKEHAALMAKRKECAANVGSQFLTAYERIRKKQKHGFAVCEAADGRCTACLMALRPQFFEDLKAGEQLMCCETCGRILYYNAPVAVDENGPGIAANPAE